MLQTIPFALEATLKLEYEYKVTAKAGYGTGQKEAQFRLYGGPLSLTSDFSIVKDEDPSSNSPSIIPDSEVEESESVRS